MKNLFNGKTIKVAVAVLAAGIAAIQAYQAFRLTKDMVTASKTADFKWTFDGDNNKLPDVVQIVSKVIVAGAGMFIAAAMGIAATSSEEHNYI